MKYHSLIVYLSRVTVLLLMVAGCTPALKFSGPIQLVPNAEIVVVHATARHEPDGIVIGGDVRRTNGYANPVPGHLHLVGLDEAGKIVAATDAPWGEFMSRRFRLAYFKAHLRTAAPSAVTKISIEPVTSPTR